MNSKARLRQVETVLQAVVEVHPVAMHLVALGGHLVAAEGHLVGVPPVAVMVLQQVVQGPPSRPVEEQAVLQEVVMVLQVGVTVLRVGGVVRWDQVPLRPMPRWLEASARRPGTTGLMLLRNIQVGPRDKYFNCSYRRRDVQERNAPVCSRQHDSVRCVRQVLANIIRSALMLVTSEIHM